MALPPSHEIDISGFAFQETLHIYHTGNPNDPTSSIPAITLTGTRPDPGNWFYVMVAGSAQEFFPFNTAFGIDEGCYDFGGLSSATEDTQRDAQAVFWVRHDITGPITVGLCHSLETGHDLIGSFLVDGRVGNSSCDSLGVGNLLGGNVTVVGGSIGNIRVGPSLAAEGIRGNISAGGNIASIWTSGPIGTSTLRPAISATGNIREVRARSVDPVTSVAMLAPVNFNMDVSAQTANGSGTLEFIEAGGDITGTIIADHMEAVVFGGPARIGIYAGGVADDVLLPGGHIAADIVIAGESGGSIYGRSVTGSVTIGGEFEGSIVGWDLDAASTPYSGNNKTPAISIANGGDPSAAFTGHGDNSLLGCPSWNFRSDSDRKALYTLTGCLDEGGFGPYIALHAAGTIDIFQMMIGEASDGAHHNRMPSIECASIDTLIIERMRTGAVWSGHFDDVLPIHPPANADRSDDYAHIGQAFIGCVGRPAHIYADEQSNIEVSSTLMGQIVMPALDAGSVVSIGDMLGADDAATPGTERCGFGEFGNANPDTPPNTGTEEPSPRYAIAVPYSAIRIADSAGLHGQIILNANASTADPEDTVRGVITLGAFNNPGTVFSVFAPTSGDPRAASSTGHVLPHYDALPGTFGGGAVGVAPFAVHQASSDQINHYSTGPEWLVTSEFNNPSPAPCSHYWGVLDFYGPIKFPNDPAEPFAATTAEVVNNLGPWYVSSYLHYQRRAFSTGGALRELAFEPWTPTGAVVLPHGTYEFSNSNFSNERVLCDGLLAASDVPADVGSVTHPATVEVKLDCPQQTAQHMCLHNGAYDCYADAAPDCTCAFGLCDSIDFNNDGLFPDTVDIDDFLSVFSGGPCTNDPNCNDIDYNNDGLFPDTLDIDALLSVFSGGPCLI